MLDTPITQHEDNESLRERTRRGCMCEKKNVMVPCTTLFQTISYLIAAILRKIKIGFSKDPLMLLQVLPEESHRGGRGSLSSTTLDHQHSTCSFPPLLLYYLKKGSVHNTITTHNLHKKTNRELFWHVVRGKCSGGAYKRQ